MRATYLCVGPDPDTWRILRCDRCEREIPERVALCFSCLFGECRGRLRPTGKYVPRKDRWT